MNGLAQKNLFYFLINIPNLNIFTKMKMGNQCSQLHRSFWSSKKEKQNNSKQTKKNQIKNKINKKWE